jgi:general secretion pathway protein N
MVRTRSLIGGGILLLALFLISLAPAWILSAALTKFAPSILTLQQAQGSIWNGRAQVQARLPQGAMLDLGPVDWHVRPWTLLTGKLGANLHAPNLPLGGNLQTDVAVGFDRVPRLTQLRAQLPAALLAQFVPQLSLMQPDGTIEVSSEALVLANNPQGALSATWRRFATKMSKVNPLGDYKLDAQLGDGPISFKLSSPAGPLLIDGSGSWSAATRLNFDGSARLAPGAPPELANLVRLFGRDQGGGTYAISLKNF